MTERKPPGISFESWIDKQIRLAQERGDFDDLPGAGKPLPDLNKPYDELRWVRNYVQREGLSTEALLPPSLRLRKEIDRLPETVGDLPSERAVRDVVEQLNVQIVDSLRTPTGPRVPIAPVNAGEMVRQWRASRQAPAEHESGQASAGETAASGPRDRWWHRVTRRLRRTG